MKYALVNNNTNIVDNIIIWDGMCQIINLELHTPVLLNQNEDCAIGYVYDSNLQPRFFAIDFYSIVF